jgi:hypothetical protein
MHQGGKKVSVKNFHRHQKPVSMEKKNRHTQSEQQKNYPIGKELSLLII